MCSHLESFFCIFVAFYNVNTVRSEMWELIVYITHAKKILQISRLWQVISKTFPAFVMRKTQYAYFLLTVFSHRQISPSPNVSTTPITAMVCWQCLPLSVVQLIDKHWQKTHCRNGVVDTFEPSHSNWGAHCVTLILCMAVLIISKIRGQVLKLLFPTEVWENWNKVALKIINCIL